MQTPCVWGWLLFLGIISNVTIPYHSFNITNRKLNLRLAFANEINQYKVNFL